jgi:hypothetical protein
MYVLALAMIAPFAYAADIPAGAPDMPVVRSAAYPDQTAWYQTPSGSFAWDLPQDVTAVAVGVSPDPNYEPTFVYKPAVRGYTPKAGELHEGVQYLAVQFKNEAGWGAIAHYRVQLDETPPVGLSITLTPDSGYPYASTLTFRADDALSGIAGYAVYVGEQAPVLLTPETAATGYRFDQKAEGTYHVVVVATDHAGNSVANHFPVFVFDVDGLVRDSDLFLGFITPAGLKVGGLTALVLLLLLYIIRRHLVHRRRVRILKTEVREVKEELHKIFRAIRDELREQIDAIEATKRRTKREQAVIDSLTRTLEVSETLVAKEVADVEKAVKRRGS